jgi:acyl-CoA thioester hydrolase
MPEKASKPLFSIKIPIRWGDMDAYGHINNAVYFRYMEEARVLMLQQLGGSLDPQSTGPVIVNAQAEFLGAVSHPDTLRVDCFAADPGRSSFMTHYELYSQQQDKLVTKGSAKVVWVDHRINQSVALPEALRSQIDNGLLAD